ncbi:hypothetical protein PO909_028666 [Leuciscus waleckii]
MLDVALLMANASQLKAVLEQGPEFKYFLTVIILIAASLFFQVLAGALFVNMARKNLNDVANQRKLDIMNNVATGLVFLTVIINIFITAFGVQKTGLYPKHHASVSQAEISVKPQITHRRLHRVWVYTYICDL